MDVKIESMIFGWDERIPDTLIQKTSRSFADWWKCSLGARSSTASLPSDMAATTCGSRRGWRQTRQNA